MITIDGKDNGLAWPAFTSINESSVLHIDSAQPKLVKNPYAEIYKFWSELPVLSRFNNVVPKPNVKNEL